MQGRTQLEEKAFYFELPHLRLLPLLAEALNQRRLVLYPQRLTNDEEKGTGLALQFLQEERVRSLQLLIDTYKQGVALYRFFAHLE